MSSDFSRSLLINLTVQAYHPNLLTGLDVWLRLGLITEERIRRLSRDCLTCPLPESAVVAKQVRKTSPEFSETDFAPEEIIKAQKVKRKKQPSVANQAWQSFKNELSVRWLLFLGVFLVVLSSGVLAATQWERFPAAGQYGVLWTYTLIFWSVGFWAGKQENLQLTSQTLKTIVLLLIPVNFWAMDTFGLWRYPWEWLTVIIAACSLTAIALRHNKQGRGRSLNSFLLTFLGLSYLHWGWGFPGFPLISVYIAMIGTAIVLRFLPQIQGEEESPGKITAAFVLFALAILLGRAIFVVHVDIQQLGLAIGICGWLLAGEGIFRQEEQGLRPTVSGKSSNVSVDSSSESVNRQNSQSQANLIPQIFEVIGGFLLFFGWLICVGDNLFWQATAISGLALHFCSQRLLRYWLSRDLLAIFVIGLQSLFLIKELIPSNFRQNALDLSVQIAHSEIFPGSVYGVTLFPYLIFFVWLTDWLYQQDKPKLAIFGEWLTFSLGVILTFLSLFNPTWGSLNFLLSTCTLAVVTYRRTPLRIPLLYLTHIFGLLTITATIDWWFGNLTQLVWAAILLVLMVIEWAISTLPVSKSDSPFKQVWYRSCWNIGFVLAGLSFVLLWNGIIGFIYSFGDVIYAFFVNKHQLFNNPEWGLLWLLTPLTLTGVASRTDRIKRTSATYLSCGALIAAQLLTFWSFEVRLISLGFATGLMLVNTRYIGKTRVAVITIGFALSFIFAIPGDRLSLAGWFLLGAIAILGLWLLYNLLRQKPGTLAAIYAQAVDDWAIALSVFELALLTFHELRTYFFLITPSWEFLLASVVIGLAIIYRYWQQPIDQAIYGVSWALEIAIAEVIVLVGGSTLILATANIIFALFTLVLTNWLLSQPSRLSRLNSLKIVPLFYALIGLGFRLEYFTAYTGLLTFGAALTGILVGSRYRKEKALKYFSLVGFSLASYELVIYQMLQASGGSPADGLTILAIIAAAIAFTYRLFAWFWRSQGNQTFLNLTLTEIQITAHIHWAIGSIFKLLAAGLALETNPGLTPISIATSLMLGAYALIQGRDPETRKGSAADWWIYVGLVEITGTTVYARLIWTKLSFLDPWRIIFVCLIALAIYQLPWRHLGWKPTPWRRAALVMPALTTLVTIEAVSYLSLLAVALFYAQIARKQKNIRWTYISLGFIDWAITRFLAEQQLTDILWYASIIGLSLLYIAQLDPSLNSIQQRKNRHYLRVLGSGIICLIALLFHQDIGLIPAIISIATIFAGLSLRIRAFLFVGTITFVLTAFYQLVFLIFTYSFLKWVIGLIFGIVLISIAANFEQRREQIIVVLQHWLEQFNHWE